MLVRCLGSFANCARSKVSRSPSRRGVGRVLENLCLSRNQSPSFGDGLWFNKNWTSLSELASFLLVFFSLFQSDYSEKGRHAVTEINDEEVQLKHRAWPIQFSRKLSCDEQAHRDKWSTSRLIMLSDTCVEFEKKKKIRCVTNDFVFHSLCRANIEKAVF